MRPSVDRGSAILVVELGGERAESTVRSTTAGLFARILGEHEGRLVRQSAGLSWALFPDGERAVRCALDLRATLTEIARSGTERASRFRAGIVEGPSSGAAGEAPPDLTRNAETLAGVARPGRICVSDTVYEGLSAALRAYFQDIGTIDAGGGLTDAHCYESGPSASAKPSADQEDAEAAAEAIAELKSIVSKYAKKAGSKISADSVKRFMPNRGPEVDRAIDRLADLGYLRKEAAGSAAGNRPAGSDRDWREAGREWRDEWQRGWRGYGREVRRETRKAVHEAMHEERHHHSHHEDDHDLDERHVPEYGDYRRRIIARAERSIAGLIPHAVTYLIINGGLLFLNLLVSPHFPWFVFPAGGWGIGMVSHIATVVEQRRRKHDVESLPENPSDEDASLIRRYHRARGGARETFFSLVSVSLFLGLVNLIVSPQFPWAVFPFAGMLIGIVSSYAAYLPVRHAFRKRRRLMTSSGSAAAPAAAPFAAEEGDEPLVCRAVELAQEVMEQSRALGSGHAALIEDLRPLLIDYIGRIRVLTTRSREVERIIEGIPREDLERDLALLKKRYAAAGNPTLKEEYRKSVETIERQNRSVAELQNQKELLDLKVANSLASLSQMRLDLARMAGASADSAAGDVALKQKAEELSEYIHDLSASYEELEAISGSGERDRLAADELMRKIEASEHPPKRPPERE